MVLSCIGLIKNAVGVIGIIILLSLLAGPVVKILSVAVVYKLIAIAAEPVAPKNISGQSERDRQRRSDDDRGAGDRRIHVPYLHYYHHGYGRRQLMTDIVKQWVSSLFIIILALSFIEILLPDSSMGKYVKFVFSLVIMATILYPVIYIAVEYR